MFGFIRQASSVLGLGSHSPEIKTSTNKNEEGVIIYCKNNVCVHPPVPLGSDVQHRPGYLTIRLKNDESHDPALILTWIPNTSLKKNPWSVENLITTQPSSARNSACPSPRRSPRRSLPSLYYSAHFSYCGVDCSSEPSPNIRVSPNELVSSSQNRSSNPFEGACVSLMAPGYNTDNASKQQCLGPEEVSEALEAMISGLNNINEHPQLNHSDQHSDEKHQDDEEGKSEIQTNSIISSETCFSVEQNEIAQTKSEFSPTCLHQRRKLKLVLNCEINNEQNHNTAKTPDIAVTSCHSEKDNVVELSPDCDSVFTSLAEESSSKDNYNCDRYAHLSSYYMDGTPESLAAAHKLHFPEQNSGSQSECSSPSRRHVQPCHLFSVDLIQMKILRLFFSNRECTCGQLVITSRESQYKIFHFHHSGLDKLAEELEKWNVFLTPKIKMDNCPYRQFSISRPQVTLEECHPEEGQYETVDEAAWLSYINEDGEIEEEFYLKKAIFFGGLDSSIRKNVWPFLLHYYQFDSTWDEREQIRIEKRLEYQNIVKTRNMMTEAERDAFWRNIQCTVEKDVVRTDRSNPFFVGDSNPNLEIMRNILLNYAVYNPGMGYTQGMSDLLAPILTEIQDEVDAFWCFVGLMQRTIFISSPKDNDMDKHLNYISELIRLMLPRFHCHLQSQSDAMELLFCHRWILLCFKREFPEHDVLRMWESCWVNYQTDYFHLFLCLAVIAIYGDDVIEQCLNADEMLLHFSSLASHMNGDLVLRKARGLLHQFRQMARIPCTLRGLCEMCGPGIWDSGHVPIVECVGHTNTDIINVCPNNADVPSF